MSGTYSWMKTNTYRWTLLERAGNPRRHAPAPNIWDDTIIGEVLFVHSQRGYDVLAYGDGDRGDVLLVNFPVETPLDDVLDAAKTLLVAWSKS